MRKVFKKIACLALALFTLIGISACSEEPISAYEIAVKNGFIGTEAEWLLSLKGADGEKGEDLDIDKMYAWAKENGFTGSYLDFLKELDLNVQEDNDTEMLAKNITSIVEIYSGFTKTVNYQDGWSSVKRTYVAAYGGSGIIYSINRNAGTAIIVTNYHQVYSSGILENVKGVDQENGISDCIWLYPYGELNYFSTGDEKQDGILTGADTDGIQDSPQGDASGNGIRARYIGGSMEYDIALLETEINEKYFAENGTATSAKLGDSNTATVGEKVYVIGNANGQGISVTNGLLSVESEYITMASIDDSEETVVFRVLRTDSAVNHGNSGGALFNAKGEVIGVINAKSTIEKTDNVGYALPITQVKYLIGNILDNRADGGYVSKATLGIYTRITQSSARIIDGKIVITEQFMVDSASILPGSASYQKLAYADVIKAVTIRGEKHTLNREFELRELLLTVRLGDTVVLHVIRDGQPKDVVIVFNETSYFTKVA